MSDIVERLKVLCDPRAECLSDGTRITQFVKYGTDARHEITRLRAENERLREALIDTIASLVASISLLERGGKKAAPSDRMFVQMLVDYRKSIDSARAALEGVTEKDGAGNEHAN